VPSKIALAENALLDLIFNPPISHTRKVVSFTTSYAQDTLKEAQTSGNEMLDMSLN
jgi:hypothetical protein